MDEERYGIAELAEAADVSVRTVRYYIAEGLLPPPVTAGARSYYTREHLARLQLIGRLKDAYLPLREIRRHLAALDDETIIELAEEAEAEEDADPSRFEVGPIDIDLGGLNEMISAKLRESFPPGFPFHRQAEQRREQRVRDREQRHEQRERERAQRHEQRQAMRSRPMQAPAIEDERRQEGEQPASPDSATEYIARVLDSTRRQHRPPTGHRRPESPTAPRPPQSPPFPGPATSAPPLEQPGGAATETLWRHIRISDDAQLLIREEAFGRRLEKIEWLVGWAKKVLS